ncbi:protein NLRC3-like [Chanos chanos]|uniref:Protein NLRC3-like n=1 Tax=Chanos chanos TaxID=29144 RepID=A0A6J2V861_CHACN|nr:protein NLRC3-like [Chanos chanos]
MDKKARPPLNMPGKENIRPVTNAVQDHIKKPTVTHGEEKAAEKRKKLFSGLNRINHKKKHRATFEQQLHKIRHEMQFNLKKRSEGLLEGTAATHQPALLNKVYTELHVFDQELDHVNDEHEIWQVETAHFFDSSEGTVIKYNDILNPYHRERTFKNVVTKGIAGIGKTITAQKFILDWSEGKANQDIDFVFVLPFRDLNLQRNEHQSLFELLRVFHPELRKIDDIRIFDRRILFILDGLDESQFPLDNHNIIVSDVKRRDTVDVLLTSLLKGRLLPSAHIWITTRPSAASQLPKEVFEQGYVTHIRGFNDQQKEEYFKNHFSDQNKALKIISCLKKTRSLFIMCHVPLFCWLASKVLKEMITDENDYNEMPKSLTEMYIHFLIIQTGFSYQKYQMKKSYDVLEKYKLTILKLGKLAFQNLMKQNFVFHERDLATYGMSSAEVFQCPGVCTCIFKMEDGLHEKTLYCFVHLTVQEFFAALFVYCEFAEGKEIKDFKSGKSKNSLADFLKCIVDKALGSKTGHLDLFTRFIFGISLDSNKTKLESLLPSTGSSSDCHKKVVQHIKILRRQDLSPERCMNLVHCLVELQDTSVLMEMEKCQKSFSEKPLTSFQCSVLAYHLAMLDVDHNKFDLKKYRVNEVGFKRLAPVLCYFKEARLNCSGITEKSSPDLVCILKSPKSQLTVLDLSQNSLQNSGMRKLVDGLCNSNCKVQKLDVSHNNLTDPGMEALKDLLLHTSSKLQILDISNNDLSSSGVKSLSVGLASSSCHLEMLQLSGCRVTEKGCFYLASALTSGSPHLRALDLSYNHPGDAGTKIIPVLLSDAVNLTLDLNTANEWLSLTPDGKTAGRNKNKQSYPDLPERFDRCSQVLSKESLSGRAYWEVIKNAYDAHIGVAYKHICRKGAGAEVHVGRNQESWNFYWSEKMSYVQHGGSKVSLSGPACSKLGVYLDWQAGTLSFYSISSQCIYDSITPFASQ